MNLNYQILWLEDTPEWVDSIKSELEDHMKELSLELKIELLANGDDIQKIMQAKVIDLLIVDYHLEGKNGDALIKVVREHGELTEIIFYSEQADGRVSRSDLDAGVHCISRDDAREQIKEVAKEFSNRNNNIGVMRGVIIAEAIDLENQLVKIINKLFGEHAELFQSKVLDERKLDFTAKHKFVQSYLKDKLKLVKSGDPSWTELNNLKNIMKTMSDDIIDYRNILAHSEKKINAEGILILAGVNKRTTEIVFNNEWKNNIRANIQKHRANLQRLYELF